MNNQNSFAGVKNTAIQEATNNTIFQIKPNSVDYISTNGQTMSVETSMTSFVNIGTAYSATLPNPTYIGQIKSVMIGDSISGSSGVITVNYNNASGDATSFSLSNVGDMDQLYGSKLGWTEW